jgi:hypothetical protein
MEVPNADQYEQPEEQAFPAGTIQALMQEAAPDPREHREDMYRIKELADLLGDAEQILDRIERLQQGNVIDQRTMHRLKRRLSITLEEKLNPE